MLNALSLTLLPFFTIFEKHYLGRSTSSTWTRCELADWLLSYSIFRIEKEEVKGRIDENAHGLALVLSVGWVLFWFVLIFGVLRLRTYE